MQRRQAGRPQHENRRQHFPRARPDAAAPSTEVVARIEATGPHRPIMLREVLRTLQPRPGDVVVDATLGGGGHAEAMLTHIRPGGRLIGLDVDATELPRAEARLRAAGYGADVCVIQHTNFADLAAIVAQHTPGGADLVLADLGVSSMQHDTPARGFNFKTVGPLDMRMDPSSGGETAAALLARLDEAALAALLTSHADEPHARLIAQLLTRERVTSTHALERTVRLGLGSALPDLPRGDIKLSIRRTLQALRIAVNGEFDALERLLDALPACLAPGGRVAILTFHSGEDRRVKKAFQAGHRAGLYASIAREVIRSTKEETRANRRASAAKLRWALRAAAAPRTPRTEY